MKIVIVHTDALDASKYCDKCFEELTDKQLLDICKYDKLEQHNIFESLEEMAEAWNGTGTQDMIIDPDSYMRIIKD